MALSIEGYSQGYTNEEILTMRLPELEATTTWLIEEGVILDSNSGMQAVIDSVHSRYDLLGVFSSVGRTHDFRYLLSIIGINYEIFKLHEVKTNNTLLEYWVVKKGAPPPLNFHGNVNSLLLKLTIMNPKESS